MNITDIIKEAFVFPSKNLGPLAIYTILTLVIAFFSVGGLIYATLVGDIIKAILGVIIFIISIIAEFILMGYQIKLVKTGIDSTEASPEFEWKDDCVTGIKYLVLKIVYGIIPLIITIIMGLVTNIPGNVSAILEQITTSLSQQTGSTAINALVNMNSTNSTEYMNALSTLNATNSTNVMPTITVSNTLISNLETSLAITAVVSIIVFLIFEILKLIAEGRLANTGSIGNALNMPQVFKEMGEIGYGKVIGLYILILIIILIINLIFGIITGYLPMLCIISIILSPYLIFFIKRATGLLYSEIA
ncbi:DUF4013 domain-containing protein [uncultured Methanobrevibacter sp.]|uniref:DUF4013 domain-containing protein n=1 Tax=uncultured Methanobrevibacter sp. TaxID=253161 RepID=UPI0025FC014F|nr:DUF4013 domain-containing protein [uncultured Methanobrevibacter sp.]